MSRTPGQTAGKGLDNGIPTPDDRSDSDPTRAEPTGERGIPALALEPDILAVFRRDVARLGLAGELTAACLIYLAITSRLLPWGKQGERPVSRRVLSADRIVTQPISMLCASGPSGRPSCTSVR